MKLSLLSTPHLLSVSALTKNNDGKGNKDFVNITQIFIFFL
jgi:hypothetical protein